MKFLIITFVLIILLGCKESENEDNIQPPLRHKNIPSTAFWHGHLDGGQWYQCKKSSDIYSFNCTVYNEHTGEIVISDNFTIFVENNGKKIHLNDFLQKGNLDSNNIIGFNGYTMGLKFNLVLVPSKDLFND